MVRQFAACVFACSIGSAVTFAQTPDQTTSQPAIRVGGAVRAPVKLRNVPPVYPDIAIASRTEGVVILEVTINTAGAVESARVIRSIPLLDQAALDAVYQWEYEPTLLNGVPVPIIYTITVNFSLKARDAADQANAAAQSGAATTAEPVALPPIDPAVIEQAAAQAVRVGGSVPAPRKITHVDAIYPPIAAQNGASGVVILELLVGADGHVLVAKVIRSVPLLDEAAVNAARQWVYEPVVVNGGPLPVYYNVTVSFSATR